MQLSGKRLGCFQVNTWVILGEFVISIERNEYFILYEMIWNMRYSYVVN